MTFFTRLRTALSLANELEQQKAKVQELENIVRTLQFEWTDTLDKLLAREERWRKRYKAEVANALTQVEAPQAQHNPQSSRDIKAGLRARLGSIRSQGGSG